MQKVYDATNALEGQMLVDLLKQEGIDGHVNGAYLQGAIGELPAAGLVRVMVDDDDVPRARALVDRWNAMELQLKSDDDEQTHEDRPAA